MNLTFSLYSMLELVDQYYLPDHYYCKLVLLSTTISLRKPMFIEILYKMSQRYFTLYRRL